MRILAALLLLLTSASAQTIGSGVTLGSGVAIGIPTPSAPAASPAAGSYGSAQSVTLAAPFGSLYYSTDGSPATAASTLYTAPIPVTSNETVNTVASFAQVTAHQTNYSAAGWKAPCYLSACNPGGSGIPTATAQTFGVASPSLSGHAMHLTQTTATPSSSGDSNVLWVWLSPTSCDQCTTLVSDFEIMPAENASLIGNIEMDTFQFDLTDKLDFMYDLQCNQTSGQWQIANQSSPWQNAGIACSLSANTWHRIIFQVHHVLGDKSCSGEPCEYFDSLTVDGVTHAIGQTMAATVLTTGYASAIGNQFQIDSTGSGASSASPLTTGLYVDNSSFAASLSTSAPTSATYTIE